MEAEGVTVRCEAEVKGVRRTGTGVRVLLEDGEVEGSHLFLAVGRRPNTDTLGLDSVGAELDEKGNLVVDERLSSTVPGLWVAGDVRGGPAFTHTAYADHAVLLDQIAGGKRRTTTGRVVPYAMFLDPELGRVGLTERQAREAGHAVRVGRREMRDSGKAKELGKAEGFIKIVVDPERDRVLGAACLCERGSEVVQLFTTLMNADIPASAMVDTIHIHPTIAEAAKNALVDALS
jgi:pyruvate/2-oxoglutarate dehydrogenase complex dihydrolipoamide dehydrogenase (E3) component